MRRSMMILFVLIGVVLSMSPANAQSLTIQYEPGWNLVALPPSGTLPQAQEVLVYDGSAYIPSTSTSVTPCTGAWAYFSTASNVTVSPGKAGNYSCQIRAGWTMVGNPFDRPAVLPTAFVAYRWDAVAARYETATSIPVGGAVWVYGNATSVITLTPVSEVIVTAPPVPSQPVSMRLGDILTVKVSVNVSTPAYTAHADPAYLRAAGTEMAGSTGYAYHWQAVATGETIVTLDPFCLPQGCRAPSYAVRVKILP